MKETKEKRGHGFAVVLLLWALALAAAVGLLLNRLWSFLESYEQGTPLVAVEKFLAEWEDLSEEELAVRNGMALSPYETPGAYKQAVREQIEGLVPDKEQLRLATTLDGDARKEVKVACGEKVLPMSLVRGKDGTWQVVLPPVETQSFTVQAPQHAQVQVNDIALEAAAAGSAVPVHGYTDMPSAPVALEYTLAGLLGAPQVTAVLGGGQECTVRQSENVFVVSAPVPPEQQQTLEEFAVGFAKLYANYISNDAAFGELDATLLPGTALRDALRTFSAYWYTDHDAVDYENLEILGEGSVGENCAWVELKLDYVVIRYKGMRRNVLPLHYRLYAVMQEGRWQMVSIDNL